MIAGRIARLLPTGGSGQFVAAAFHRLFALVCLAAWISLGSQVSVLIGPRGLMPLGDFLAWAETRGGLPWLAYPSLLRWPALATDTALAGGTVLGAVLSLGALAGLWPRACFAASTFLYLGYAAACRTFLSFQWDNLLLECGLLACFLPAHRPAPVAHFLLRVLAFKLYFESGAAKWLSPLHDWHDGSAMTWYYETAPLPTWLGWHAHNLPEWWHRFESRAALAVELLVPFAMFGPRRARLGALAVLTGFQVVNLATANYGFFCYLALALHVFLLDERDMERLPALVGRLVGGLRRALSRTPSVSGTAASDAGVEPTGTQIRISWRTRILRLAAIPAAGTWLLVSLAQGLETFAPPLPWQASIEPLRRIYDPVRLVNAYHLFASITRERIEPEFQAQVAGEWRPLHLRHKPGDPARAPDFVAPHQPRVDFQLWFHGLAHLRRPPAYVTGLADRLCSHPGAVAGLFRDPVPRDAGAIRVAYWRFHFTTRAERRRTGAWWRRDLVTLSAERPCRRS